MGVVAGDAMVRSWGVEASMFPVPARGGGTMEWQVSGFLQFGPCGLG
jgi:hypothetical protein